MAKFEEQGYTDHTITSSLARVNLHRILIKTLIEKNLSKKLFQKRYNLNLKLG